MHLIQYRQAMALVRLAPDSPDPDWAQGGPLVSISRTSDEISVVCPTFALPEPVPGPVEGPFTVTRAAGAGIPVLSVSTFDTDWVLVPAAQSVVAASVWRHAGYTVTEDAE